MDDLFESVGREKEASVELDDFTDIVLELKVTSNSVGQMSISAC